MTIFVPVLCFLLAIAFVGIPLTVGVDRNMNGWLMCAWISAHVLIIAAIGEYWWDHRPPQLVYELPTSSWSCSSTYTARVFTGKIWIEETRCSQYSIHGEGK